MLARENTAKLNKIKSLDERSWFPVGTLIRTDYGWCPVEEFEMIHGVMVYSNEMFIGEFISEYNKCFILVI